MQVSELIRAAVAGEALPDCPQPSANERQAFDAWSRAGIIHGEGPPPTLRDIVETIQAARGVTLYRESRQ